MKKGLFNKNRLAFTLAKLPDAGQYGPKRAAFTLAEVFITLGIIGVVAALTIPTLTKAYQKHITLTRVKQTYSMFAQALKLSEIDHDNISQWNIPSVSSPNTLSNAVISEAFADEYFIKYLKGAQKYKNTSTSYKGVAWYKLQNGAKVYVWPRGTWGEIGIYTSDAKTYKSGKNQFCLVFTKFGRGATNMPKGGVYFYGYGYNRTTLKNDNNYGCNNKNAHYYGLYCGALIQTDGWKVSSDYDWR